MNFLDKLKLHKDFSLPSEKFDLQSHTYFSDGRKSPEDLITSASSNGLKYISITDHNGLQAYSLSIFNLAKSLNLTIIPGIEMECFGELDILVYDQIENNISKKFSEDIAEVANFINEKRNRYVLQGIENIKNFLLTSSDINWMNWKNFSDQEKNKILEFITIENASNVNLETGNLESFNRKYISKPHFGILLSRFNLINLEEFAKSHGLPIEKAAKGALKILFDKYIDWPLDHLDPDLDIIKKISTLSFVKIIAHPGKSFETLRKNHPDVDFSEYLNDLLDMGLDGAEIDYRNYKKIDVDYNKLTLEILSNYKRSTIGTGGSDTHSLFGE